MLLTKSSKHQIDWREGSYFPHCWQYLLLSPSSTTALAFAHCKQTRCRLWYPLSSLISATHPGTWQLAGTPPELLAVRVRFLPGSAASSSSSFASSSGQAHGITPAKKFEHVSLGSLFLIRPELSSPECSGGWLWSTPACSISDWGKDVVRLSSRLKSRKSDQSKRDEKVGSSRGGAGAADCAPGTLSWLGVVGGFCCICWGFGCCRENVGKGTVLGVRKLSLSLSLCFFELEGR